MILLIRQRLVAFLVFVSTVVLLAILFLTYQNTRDMLDSQEWIDHTQQVLLEAEMLAVDVKDIQVNARVFLITRDESLLVTLSQKEHSAFSRLNSLRELVADNPAQLARVESLVLMTSHRPIVDVKSGQSEEALKGIFIQTKAYEDAFVDALDKFQGEEYRQLDLARYNSNTNVNEFQWFLGVMVLVFILLAVAILFTLRYNRKLNEQLNERTSELAGIFDRITDGVFVLDKDFSCTYVNKAGSQMVRMETMALVGNSIFKVFPDLINTPTHNAMAVVMKEQRYVKLLDYFPPLGLWYEAHLYPVGEGITMFVRDMTKQMQAEEKLLQSERLYRSITSSIPGSVIVIIDKDYRYVLIEGDMVDKLGYHKPSIFGRTAKEVLKPERYAEIEPFFKRAFSGESFSVEIRRDEYDLLTRYVPLKNEHNEINSVMAVSIDVTFLKEAERKSAALNVWLESKVQERTVQLENANKELESFSYSVAHDLRAPLRAVSGYSSMLAEEHGPLLNSDAQRLITEVQKSARRMATLIEDLLHFSKLGRKEVRKGNIDMQLLIDEALSELPATKVDVKFDKLTPVYGDFSLIKAVVVNLLSNAIKYSSKCEHPEIRISSTIHENLVTYSIVDNGVGFDMQYAKELFGVFQRLHSQEQFEGTGVGLAIVKRIINRHGGQVWAYSKVNEGATFFFTLPKIPSEQENAVQSI